MAAVSRQDCQLITHHDTVQRYRAYQAQRAAPEASKMERRAAEKLIAKENKKAADAAKRAAAKQVEAQRRAALTPQPRAEEDARKSAQKKAEKDAIAPRLAAARALVSQA